MSLFSGLGFTAPWILAALAVLPAIWFLLRVTPPAPRRVIFPPLRLLMGLAGTEETPARTPWWLLLLRLIVAALVIIALAEPILGERPKPVGGGPLVLFIDNGWPAAHAWSAREDAISDALTAANNAGRAVALLPTADPPKTLDLMDAGRASRAMPELAPKSWLPEREKALAVLKATKFAAAPEILWLSDGLDYGHANEIASALSRIGALRVVVDAPGKEPLALKPETSEPDGFKISLIRAGGIGARKGTVVAIGSHGENLANAAFAFANGASAATAKIALPLEVRNQTRRVVIANEDSAGAVRLMDSSSRRRSVGLVSAGGNEAEQPMLSDIYYLERALSPYADLHKGTVADVLSHDISVLVLADIGKIAGADHARVDKFVDDGGVLIRFAGGRMTENVDDLVPVKLRTGGRYLGGALAWAEPQHLAPFPDSSPFKGLPVPDEVTVSRQILAEPSIELSEHSWARLKDGTPLVTAARRGKGWIVLFHVTAGPSWSSLPLSGLYVEMLRRLLDLSGAARPSDLATGAAATFPALSILDGFGHEAPPPADVLPIRGSELAKARPSPAHPTGLYGTEGAEVALNATDASTALTPLGSLGVETRTYSARAAIALRDPLLALALALLLADALISLWLRGLLRLPRWAPGAFALAVLIAAPHARADDAFDMKAALDTRLAYVITGVPEVDAMSKAGLTGLGLMLKARTSYEPETPMGVNPATDDLSFFPLLYWPMDPRERDLSPQAIANIQNYMRNGGTILFDTRDLTLGAARGPDNSGEVTLRRLLAKLDIPPLEPVPSDHVLTKSFYLIQDFPGRWAGGKVWVQALPPPDPSEGPRPARGGDGVSPVIIGGNDWASAWAVDSNGEFIAACVPGGEEQREYAFRFGINVVMYALTGNYKTDQVHAPALLRRMGHEQ